MKREYQSEANSAGRDRADAVAAEELPVASGRAHRRRFVDLDFGTLTVESQDLGGVEDFDANQLICRAVIEEHLLRG